MNIGLLNKLCTVPGAPGFEQRIRECIISEVKDYVDELKIDAMGSIHAIKHGTGDKKVMVAAHMDEIAFIVTHIDDNGFVKFHPLGGFDPKTLTAQRVWIHGRKDVIGVMGSKPIHVMTADEKTKAPKITDFFIDTGLSAKEVKEIIHIGDSITREREFIEMGNNINCKSVDNRVSVFILIEALKNLQKTKTDASIYGVFTVQEEVGIRGAMAAASGVNADFGINLDVTLAFDLPGAQPHEKCTSLGEGTAIKVMDGMTICDYRMVNFMKDVASKNNIKHQLEILTAGGTDTAGIQRSSQGGAIVGGISIPCRYLHQVIEMADKSDIQASIDLLVASLKTITTFDWSFR
jgi:tetrahedral aminopeptidase